ncbi:unnamed protein product [Urochloa humidicola]
MGEAATPLPRLRRLGAGVQHPRWICRPPTPPIAAAGVAEAGATACASEEATIDCHHPSSASRHQAHHAATTCAPASRTLARTFFPRHTRPRRIVAYGRHLRVHGRQWQEQVLPGGGHLRRGRQELYGFYDFEEEVDHPGVSVTALRVTTFTLKLGENGDLTTGAAAGSGSSVPEGTTRGFQSNPVAFWM